MLNLKKPLSKFEEFLPQTNGEISDSIVQNWTPQAIECYDLNCECRLCSIKKGNYSFVCQMPKIIKRLVKLYGKPRLEGKVFRFGSF